MYEALLQSKFLQKPKMIIILKYKLWYDYYYTVKRSRFWLRKHVNPEGSHSGSVSFSTKILDRLLNSKSLQRFQKRMPPFTALSTFTLYKTSAIRAQEQDPTVRPESQNILPCRPEDRRSMKEGQTCRNVEYSSFAVTAIRALAKSNG